MAVVTVEDTKEAIKDLVVIIKEEGEAATTKVATLITKITQVVVAAILEILQAITKSFTQAETMLAIKKTTIEVEAEVIITKISNNNSQTRTKDSTKTINMDKHPQLALPSVKFPHLVPLSGKLKINILEVVIKTLISMEIEEAIEAKTEAAIEAKKEAAREVKTGAAIEVKTEEAIKEPIISKTEEFNKINQWDSELTRSFTVDFNKFHRTRI